MHSVWLSFCLLFLTSVVALSQTPGFRSQRLADQPLSSRTGLRSERLAKLQERRLARLSGDEAQPHFRGRLRSQGIARALVDTTVGEGSWTTLADGSRVWRLAITSPEAWGIRIHLHEFHVGGGRVWVYLNGQSRDASEFAGPYTADGVHSDGDFWTEPIPGDSVVLEYAPAAGDSSERPPFVVDRILHLYSPVATNPQPQRSLQVQSDSLTVLDGPSESVPGTASLHAATPGVQSKCSPDVRCYSAWTTQSNAVASISFVEGQYSYSCTGSLIEDPSGKGQPTFLTAGHCVSTDEVARTVVSYFDYQAPTCGGTPPSYFDVPRVNGARHLMSRAVTEGDFSILQLSGQPPSSATRLSLAANPDPPVGEQVVGIHHPGRVEGGSSEPNSKRISFGTESRPQNVNVAGAIVPADRSLVVQWTPGQGYTEPGSSGSPLFSKDGKLLGVLSAGAEEGFTSACNPTTAIGVYSKLSVYMADITGFFNPGSPATPAPPTNTPGTATGSTTACELRFASPPSPIAADAGSWESSFSLTDGCQYTLTTTARWISASYSAAGPNARSLKIQAAPNTSATARTATVWARNSARDLQAYRILQRPANGAQRFADVTSEHPFADHIQLLAEQGVATNCSPNNFCPDAPMTRSELAVFLVRSYLKSDTFSFQATPYFSDVPASHPNFRYIQKVRELGFTLGCTATTYCPDSTVTRGQIAPFLVRMLYGDSFPYSQRPWFNDVPVNGTAYPYIQKLRDLGITSGCTATDFCESLPNTRGEMAVFLIRAFYSN